MPALPVTGASTIWLAWTSNVTNTTAATNTAEIWTTWTSNTAIGCGAGVALTPLTPEERERREREAEASRQELAAAQARARELLLATLTRAQRREFDEYGHFHVETRDGARRYRLRPGTPPLRVQGEDGCQWSYCIHPPDWGWPHDDIAVALKLLIETDEDRFLEIANASPLRTAVNA